MIHFDIYLPPFNSKTTQATRNQLKNDAVRILKTNNSTKNTARTINDAKKVEKAPSKLPILPKVYEFSAEYFKPNIKQLSIYNPERKIATKCQTKKATYIARTNLNFSFTSSIDLNSESSVFTVSDTDSEGDSFELSDSNMVDKSYLDFYVRHIDYNKSHKTSVDQKSENNFSLPKPVLSLSSTRSSYTKRVLNLKHVSTYNIINQQNESISLVRGVKASRGSRRNSKNGSSNVYDSNAYCELIKSRDLSQIAANKSKYKRFWC